MTNPNLASNASALEDGARVLDTEAARLFVVGRVFDREDDFDGDDMRERAARMVAAGYALRVSS